MNNRITESDLKVSKFSHFEQMEITIGHKRDAELYACDMRQYEAVRETMHWLGFDKLINEIIELPEGSLMSGMQNPNDVMKWIRSTCESIKRTQ